MNIFSRRFWMLVCIAFFMFGTDGLAAFRNEISRPEKEATRGVFLKTVMEAAFDRSKIDACDSPSNLRFQDVKSKDAFAKHLCLAFKKGIVKGFKDQSFRPKNDITLAEASVILVKAFDLEEESSVRPTTDPQAPWYSKFIQVLEENYAIPPSLWSWHEKITRGEMAELVYRLKNRVYGEDTPKAQAVTNFAKYNMPANHADFFRVIGDFEKPLPGHLLNSKMIQALFEPAVYQLFDQYAEVYDPGIDCHRYAMESVTIKSSTEEIPENLKATFRGESVSVCDLEYPHPDMGPGTCPLDAQYSDDPRCNIGKPISFTLTVEKLGKELFIKGASSNRLKIIRMPIEKLCIIWTEACPRFYEHTEVETKGTLRKERLPTGEEIEVYRTPWKPIFNDLRGVPYLKVSKRNDDGTMFTAIHYDPTHNRNHYGSFLVPYDKCFTIPEIKFCLKKEGGNLVIGSHFPLGDSVTLWVDEHFRR